MFNILVVEDDRDLRELFCAVLADHGFHPIPAADGAQALSVMESRFIDLVITDIMMPGMDGWELTRQLRTADRELPILMITALDAMMDKQRGFSAGTDDYMVKPVDVNEMVWRVQALLRRAKAASERTLTVGNTVLRCDDLSVSCGGETQELPQKEFFLLFKLLGSINRIFTRRQIIDDVWGVEFESDTHTLDVHISRLRERFKQNPDFEIVTVRGLGYKAVKKI